MGSGHPRLQAPCLRQKGATPHHWRRAGSWGKLRVVGRSRLRGAFTQAVRAILGAAVLLIAASVLGQAGCADNYVCVGDQRCLQVVTNEANCLATDGCRMEPSCRDVDCDTFTDELDCNAVEVCAWSSNCVTNSRWGNGTCASATTEAECSGHELCSWEPACQGKAKECTDIDDHDECTSQPACSWEKYPSTFQLG
jgi:hypothetical protein